MATKAVAIQAISYKFARAINKIVMSMSKTRTSNLWFNKSLFLLLVLSLKGKSIAHGPKGVKRLDGFRLDEVMVLEIFAGTALLSRAIRDVGMSAMAVDKDSQRAQSVHIATYDLNEPDQVAALSDFIVKHSHIILWAHFAPSCGTASRARGRPLPKLAKMASKCPTLAQ